MSVVIVLVVPASVIVVRELGVLFPLAMPAISNITMIPPTVHTQGAARLNELREQ